MLLFSKKIPSQWKHSQTCSGNITVKRYIFQELSGLTFKNVNDEIKGKNFETKK